ncbi:hypothetical protein Pmani_025697 [Petrolisthes manimaculis]|uniref:Uncharacterized protein n=1 Tax=Petrolisthes manimaculis TaxID=1843537 RepID=A0AAE1P7G5_9EUCA|nr:hypothetical protein Pmani_025697 [Petrolisthes manimaculis]
MCLYPGPKIIIISATHHTIVVVGKTVASDMQEEERPNYTPSRLKERLTHLLQTLEEEGKERKREEEGKERKREDERDEEEEETEEEMQQGKVRW